MISDVLSDAIVSIEEYQNSDATKECYTSIATELTILKKLMTMTRQFLDAPQTDNLAKPFNVNDLVEMAESIQMSQKTFNLRYNIGHAKYVVNFYDGITKHNDGSPFFDIAIFKNIKKRDKFIKELKEQGYVER